MLTQTDGNTAVPFEVCREPQGNGHASGNATFPDQSGSRQLALKRHAQLVQDLRESRAARTEIGLAAGVLAGGSDISGPAGRLDQGGGS